MSDRYSLWLDPHRLEYIELFHRALAKVGVRENCQARRNLCFTHGAKYFALCRSHRVPRADLAKRSNWFCPRLTKELVRNLLLAPSFDLGRVERLRVVSESRNDGHSRAHRKLL